MEFGVIPANRENPNSSSAGNFSEKETAETSTFHHCGYFFA
jgi:hypothetical protein